MGLLPSSLKLLIQYDKKYEFEGPVLSLGNQEIWASYADLRSYFEELGRPYREVETIAPQTSYMFSSDPALAVLSRDFVHARVFFEMLGLDDYADMDKFDSDQPTYLHDLNLPVPDSLCRPYSLILDGGTIEHIFDVRQVLANIVQMLKPGGCVVHISSYSIDHGFYGLSPCLFHDFYSANGFEDFSCHVLQVDFRNILKTYKKRHKYFEYKYGMNFQGLLDTYKQTLIFFAARKAAQLDEITVPVQGIYKNRFGSVLGTGKQEETLSNPKSTDNGGPGFAPFQRSMKFVRSLIWRLRNQKNAVENKNI
jgi:SAM-dependent methyltransferase